MLQRIENFPNISHCATEGVQLSCSSNFVYSYNCYF